MSNYDGYKIVILGESGVGKTSLMKQFLNGKYDENFIANISAQFCKKNVKLPGGQSIEFEIWDTAGQEKFRSLNRIYYLNTKVAILVYDVTDRISFNEVKDFWYNEIKENSNKDVIIAIAANKSDLYETREVSNEDGEEFAKSIGAIFASTSAKNDFGITSLFENIAMKIITPDFDFFANEQKLKEKYESKKKKTKKGSQNNDDNSNNTVKLSNMPKKKRRCC